MKKINNYIENIKIRYHREKFPNLESIKIFEQGDFVDLRSAERVEFKAGEYKPINLGVSIELPEGYWGECVPRSSTFKNHGIIMVNSKGVFDESYCGDDDYWYFLAYATRDTVIEENERICQFRIVPKIPFNIQEVEKLEGINRGGIGSTGKL